MNVLMFKLLCAIMVNDDLDDSCHHPANSNNEQDETIRHTATDTENGYDSEDEEHKDGVNGQTNKQTNKH